MVNYFDNLDKVDFYAGIASKFIEIRVVPYLKKYFNDNQISGATLLRNLSAGFGLFEEPPDTGKTHFLSKIITSLMMFDKTDNTHHRVLVTCFINNLLNDIALKLQSFIETELKDSERKFMIIRYHTVATEQEIAMKPAKDIRGSKDGDRPLIWSPEDVSDEMNNIIETINLAKLVLELHE
jgi:hypothetical protein